MKKLLLSLVIALMVHQLLALLLFSGWLSLDYWLGNWSELQQKIDQANAILANHVDLDTNVAKSWTDVQPPDVKTALNRSPLKVVQLCLVGSWKIEPNLRCPENESNHAWHYFGYGVTIAGAAKYDQAQLPENCIVPADIAKSTKVVCTSKVDRGIATYGQFFALEDLPSRVHISGSLETMLRAIERVAFNEQDVSDVSLRLCTGTRDAPDDPGCTTMASVHGTLVEPINAKINGVRARSLFLGLFQWLTLTVFVYFVVEWHLLRGLWVRPGRTLFTLDDAGHISPKSFAALTPGILKTFKESKLRSIEDRMFSQVLAVAQRLELVLGDAAPMPKNYYAREGMLEAIDSYREHLMNDAMARLEILEVLGDSMLKLAFMGTVYGISAALFSARGLDTADPIGKLLAKAEMYSGIGIGFGTTLVGIILSIIAAQMRSSLSHAWLAKIGNTYELIREYGMLNIMEQSKQIRLQSDTLEPYVGVIEPVVLKNWGWRAILTGGIVTLIVVALVAWRMGSAP